MDGNKEGRKECRKGGELDLSCIGVHSLKELSLCTVCHLCSLHPREEGRQGETEEGKKEGKKEGREGGKEGTLVKNLTGSLRIFKDPQRPAKDHQG